MKSQNKINRNFPLFIYFFCFAVSGLILWQGRNFGLFPMPSIGMDQLNFLENADNLLKGIMPNADYRLSFSYTVLLALYSIFAGGKILVMRIFQIALCSLIPVIIFKLCRLLRCSFLASQAAAFIYCFYGPAILISISFLRAGPLALCFICSIYLLVKGFYSKKTSHYLAAGLLAGLAILGRETFIPVAASPFIMLIFPLVRKHVKYRKTAIYLAGILVLILPIITYNYIRFDSLQIIPNNFSDVFRVYHGKDKIGDPGKLTVSIVERIPSQIKMFASSYEEPNSLSFYAHREIIDMLNVLFIPFNLILGMAILALFLDWKHLRTIFVGGMAAGYFLTILYFTMFYRFRMVDFPLLCVLSAICIQVLSRIKERRVIIYILSAVFVVGFFLATYTSPNELRPAGERRSSVILLIRCKEYYKAEQLIDELIADEKPLNDIEKYLVISLDKDGSKDEAKRLYLKYSKKVKK
jgi:hypothetical protein